MEAELVQAAVSGVASKVTEIVFDPIKREISYVFKYQSYLDDLKKHVEQLGYRRQMVEEPVNRARTQGDEIYEGVQQWLISVNEFTRTAANSITAHEEEAKKSCFKGQCPNPLKRYKFSKKAVKAAKEGAHLLGEGNFSSVSYRPVPEKTEFKNADRGYQQFDSRMTVFLNVMEVLKDSKVNMIGVYGMGGVGKTTLVKEVGRQAMEEKLFHEVVMAEVTQSPDPKEIQDQIANCLNLSFDINESVYGRAGLLCRRLKNKNKVLVILDNLWGKLGLETVGIPSGGDEQRQCCTILLTSRSQDVLRNDMNSQKNFHIDTLGDTEAMSLFQKSIGDHFTQTHEFQRLAVEIVGKCGGLPIAIKTLAVALKYKSLPVWRDALKQLRNSNLRGIPRMLQDVYLPLKLSYDNLKNEEVRSLFLLCALQKDGSQIFINNLVMYVMGLDWFENVDAVEDGRNRVHALIEELKIAYLLSDGDNKHVVKMHDVIHDVAVTIAREKYMFNVRDADDLKKELEKEMQKDPTAISLRWGDNQELPERLECPRLKLFLLFAYFNHEENSLPISDLFFEGMKELKVLHLTGIGKRAGSGNKKEKSKDSRPRACYFPSISSSLGRLINLHTLSLNHVDSIGDVAIVGKLKKLEILSFRGSNIEFLPSEIGQLTQLKLLDLGNCRSLKVIAPNVISKLSRLEELYMGDSFTRWEKKKEENNASLVELKALSKLTTLDIDIPNVIVMPQDFVSVGLERYKICIGDEWDWSDRQSLRKYERMLKLAGLDRSIVLGSGMKKLLKNIEYLRLNTLNGFQDVVHELANREDFQQLKHLHVQNRSEILFGVNSTTSVSPGQNLTNLTVEECSRLQFLFSYSMVNSLGQLQKLVVENCDSMERVIDTTGLGRDEERMIQSVVFPKLEYLKLSRLSELTRFMSMSSSDSEEENNLLCPGPQLALFDEKWHHQLTSNSLCKLEELHVISCNKLTSLFSSNIIMERRFEKLEILTVTSCYSIKEIIEEETNSSFSTSGRRFAVFPQLINVELWGLPKLESIYQGTYILECPALVALQVFDCDKVEILVDHHKVAFPNLKTLKVGNCDGLRNLLTLFTVESQVKLARMEISDCKMIEKIMEMQVGERVKEDPTVFSQLEYLELDNLSRLESFCLENYTLEFPYLEQVVVCRCPSMKTFSQGLLLTPKLHEVQLLKNGMEKRWEGNLNSTIQKFFQGMDLKLSDFPCLKEIWDGHAHDLPVSVFENITSLVVDDCTFMSSAIPANLLPLFFSLRYLEVRNCDSVEEVFHFEDTYADEVGMFPVPPTLKLVDLPKLKRFCNFAANIIILYRLRILCIENCPNVETFISNSTPEHTTANREPQERISEENFLTDIQPLFDEKVACPDISELKLSRLPKLLHLWKENPHPIKVFQYLNTVELSKCDGLINLVTLSTVKNLASLTRMNINDCKMIEEIIQPEVGEEVEKDSTVFNKLQYLGLSCLPSLTSFCLGNYTLEFPSLEHVLVRECPKMEIFSRGVLSTPKLQKLQLTELDSGEEGRWEGSLNSTIQKLFQETNSKEEN